MTTLDMASFAHSMNSHEWYTRRRYLKTARQWVGGKFDLDPATSDDANKEVRAAVYYTRERDGLDRANRWAGRVWMNPPSPAGPWIDRFVEELLRGSLGRSVVLAYNADQMGRWAKHRARIAAVTPFYLMHPDHRIQCVRTVGHAIDTTRAQLGRLGPEDKRRPRLGAKLKALDEIGDRGEFVLGDQPAHPSVFLGFPATDGLWGPPGDAWDQWRLLMGRFGLCSRVG